MFRWPLQTRGSSEPAEVLVVLGAALARDGGLGPALAERVAAGVAAWHRRLAPRLLMTGAREATAMRNRAVELGVPPDAIWIEHASLTTRDNAVLCAAILRGHGVRRALIVTQPYHRRRAVAAFRHAGVDAAALQFAGERESVRVIAREYVALAAYAARGWL
jgi:uncharacterized SAM-binding protein YcdF (DUF218 family)